MEKELEEKEIITTEEDMDKNDPENKKYDESRIYYVYEHIRLDKMEPFYIGKGKGERAYELYRNDHHDAITDKYGHAVVIIADNLTEEEAYWLERDTIEDYVFNLGNGIDIKGHDDYDHVLPHLTNMDWGGIGGKGGVKLTEETKQKMKGRIPWNKGKKGIYHNSEEQNKKISEAGKGRKCSEETKLKISEKVSGEKNGMWGKNAFAGKTEEEMETIGKKISEKLKGRKCSEEHKRKLSKKVTCITTGETFDSQTEAAIHYKVARKNISECCKGKRKHAGKLNGVRLQWKYAEDDDNESKAV